MGERLRVFKRYKKWVRETLEHRYVGVKSYNNSFLYQDGDFKILKIL